MEEQTKIDIRINVKTVIIIGLLTLFITTIVYSTIKFLSLFNWSVI